MGSWEIVVVSTASRRNFLSGLSRAGRLASFHQSHHYSSARLSLTTDHGRQADSLLKHFLRLDGHEGDDSMFSSAKVR